MLPYHDNTTLYDSIPFDASAALIDMLKKELEGGTINCESVEILEERIFRTEA